MTPDDYKRVARIHRESICTGFLSSLGVRFLSLLYEAIDKSEQSVLLVFRVDDDIVGFVAASRDLGDVYRIMLRSWGRLLLSLFPALLSPKNIYRIVETVLFSRRKVGPGVDGVPSDELLSIAVLPGFRGRGCAERLFLDLVEYFRFRNILRFKIVVGDALAPAHRFYLRMNARPFCRAEVHKGCGSVVYVREV